MARPPKYTNADDLLNNTTEHGECLIWPDYGSNVSSPVLSPASPLAKLFMTNSVPRILFTICRFVPEGRLVRCCDNPFCVNPYHFVESHKVRRKRITLSKPDRPFRTAAGKDLDRMTTPTDLLPTQAVKRHLIAPDEETLRTLRPSDPKRLLQLANSAAQAGFDGKGVLSPRNTFIPIREARIVDPSMPVLRMRFNDPRKDPTKDIVSVSIADIEAEVMDDGWLDKIKAYKQQQAEKKATQK